MFKKIAPVAFSLAIAILAAAAVLDRNVTFAQAAVPQEELSAAEIELDALCTEMKFDVRAVL